MNNRRKFLRVAGAMTAGSILFPQFGCGDPKSTTMPATPTPVATPKPSLDKFGLQLYTLRDVMPKNPRGTLKEVAKYGYQQIEGYEGPQGMFWGMSNQDYYSFLNDLNMKMVSSHVDINKDLEKKAAQAAEIGMDYLVCPYVGPQKSMDDWKKITDKFNTAGAVCKKEGVNFAYHNHAYSFKAFSGMIPHDYLMENTDPDLVKHEMDIYWVVTGGADPIEYLKKYPNRFRLCHVKDRMKNAGEEQTATCTLGTGTIDFPSILKVAEENGMQYFIVEQERYDDSTPLASVKANAEYMSKLVFS